MSLKHVLLGAAGSMVIAAPGLAQDVQEVGGLEEIVVTAQKREQNLQNVPVAVTALNAEVIANQRIADFADLTRAAPGQVTLVRAAIMFMVA